MLIRKSASLAATTVAGRATHASGAVVVEFDPDGSLRQIVVAPSWEQALKPAELTSAIVETLVRARDGDVDADPPAARDLSDDEVRAIRERKLEEVSREMFVPRSEEETRELVASLPGSLAELNAALSDFVTDAQRLGAQVSAEPIEVERRSVTSSNAMVAVEVAAGTVVGARVVESWAVGRSGATITECFNEAIEQLPAVLHRANNQ